MTFKGNIVEIKGRVCYNENIKLYTYADLRC